MSDETKCVYCGDPSAHPGTRKCSDSTACDLRMAYQDVRALRAENDRLRTWVSTVSEALGAIEPVSDCRVEMSAEASAKIAESLRAALERANEGVRYWTDLAQAEARDAAALRALVADMESIDEALRQENTTLRARVAELAEQVDAWRVSSKAVVDESRALWARVAELEAYAKRGKKA